MLKPAYIRMAANLAHDSGYSLSGYLRPPEMQAAKEGRYRPPTMM